jgi:hypothetical protein
VARVEPIIEMSPPWVGEYLRCEVSTLLAPGLVGQEWAVRRTGEHVAFEMNAYVLGRVKPPAAAWDVVSEPADWRQHWKLSVRWWSTCLERHPLASWAIAHPRAALALRNPLGRWALRRPLVLWLNRRWPVRYRNRTVEVRIPRRVLYPYNELPEPSPDQLGRPVVVFEAPSLHWHPEAGDSKVS